MMSFSDELGSSKHADAALLSSDGTIFPIHIVIIKCASKSKRLADLIDVHLSSGDKKSPIAVQFDKQTVWRVLSYIYTGTYSDDDAILNFDQTTPPPAQASRNLVEDSPNVDSLASGFRMLQIAPKICKSVVLSKALASMRLHIAATVWAMDRLTVESSERFAGLITGASVEEGFTDLVEAVFSSVPESVQMLSPSIVHECVANLALLLADDKFKYLFQHYSSLALLILKEQSGNPGSLLLLQNGNDDQVSMSVHQSAMAEKDDRITQLERQLANTAASLSLQDDIKDLKAKNQQLTTELRKRAVEEHTEKHLGSKLSHAEGQIKRLQAQNDALKSTLGQGDGQSQDRTGRTNNTIPQLRSKITDLEGKVVRAEKNAGLLEKELDKADEEQKKLSNDLVAKAEEIKSRDNLIKQLTQQVNNQRSGQANSTNLMTQLREACENLQNSNTRVAFLEGKIRDKEQELEQVKRAKSAAPRREVNGYGSLAPHINAINGASRPHGPVAPASAQPTNNGIQTFVQRMARVQNAGSGGDLISFDSPPSAPGPHNTGSENMPPTSPSSNMQLVSRPSSDMQLVPRPTSNMQVATNSALVVRQNATAASDNNDRAIIRRLQQRIEFLQKQLSDSRNGPTSTVQTRNIMPVHANGHANSRVERRLEAVLKALKEAALDHKCCNNPECMLNFNSQFRGVVDDHSDDKLTLLCSACGDEKVRWWLP